MKFRILKQERILPLANFYHARKFKLAEVAECEQDWQVEKRQWEQAVRHWRDMFYIGKYYWGGECVC